MPAAPHHPFEPARQAAPGAGQSPASPLATPDDLADLRLVESIRRGEPRAWHDLLTKYQDRLYGVCLRVIGDSPRARQTAADLTQDAMVKIIQGINSYDGSAKLSTWMIRVTMNVCLSHLRSQKLRRHASLDAPTRSGESSGIPPASGSENATLADFLSSREPTADQRVSQEQTRARVAAALAVIDPEQRALLVLRDANGLDYHQIAQALSVPVGTIKSRIFRARLALRQAFESQSKPPTV